MIKKSLFIFDVDGTLVDSYCAIARSLNLTRGEFGLSSVSITKIKRSVGGGDEIFINKFFSKNKAQKALRIFRKHHKTDLVKFAQLMPDTKRVLSQLRKNKKQLAVASNRPYRFTRILLDQLKIAKYFDGVWCADQVKALKPNPKILNTVLEKFSRKAKEAVYIGDMDIDLETAKRAKIDAVFVRGGSSTLSQVKGYRKKKVISGLKKILELYN
ncbi:MAG: HAD family hydrolase [Candidatus Omnitrophica bacterium]|nr:HAD family hydrolase [Candidatus Omnitrophota bacterium]